MKKLLTLFVALILTLSYAAFAKAPRPMRTATRCPSKSCLVPSRI